MKCGEMRKLLWWWKILERVMGEGDYTRYCEHLRARHPNQKAPTEKEFYLSRLNEKYSRPNRCC
jgi:uncharacterized short protein YbdD (DUF466 family)